jgi:hypothetical protein
MTMVRPRGPTSSGFVRLASENGPNTRGFLLSCPSSLRRRPMAGQGTLDPWIMVRIHAPEPSVERSSPDGARSPGSHSSMHPSTSASSISRSHARFRSGERCPTVSRKGGRGRTRSVQDGDRPGLQSPNTEPPLRLRCQYGVDGACASRPRATRKTFRGRTGASAPFGFTAPAAPPRLRSGRLLSRWKASASWTLPLRFVGCACGTPSLREGRLASAPPVLQHASASVASPGLCLYGCPGPALHLAPKPMLAWSVLLRRRRARW